MARRLRLGRVRRFRLRARLGSTVAPFPATPQQTVHEVFPHTAFRLSLSHSVYRMFKQRRIESFPLLVIGLNYINKTILLLPDLRIHTLPFT